MIQAVGVAPAGIERGRRQDRVGDDLLDVREPDSTGSLQAVAPAKTFKQVAAEAILSPAQPLFLDVHDKSYGG